jgi:hypothetical protein
MTPRTTASLRTIRRMLGVSAVCFAALATLTGCPKPITPDVPKERWHPIPADPSMPVFLKGTIKDLTVSANTGTFPVSSYGLVTGLRGTGDSTAPAVVREWMIKEMARHKFGSPSGEYQAISPETMLADPHVAIVSVVANIPPGARKGDQCDVIVQALPNNNTTSLANGMLFLTTLKYLGTQDPFGAVNEFAKAQGNIFVNPAYAIATPTQTAARASLRTGMIPNGGVVTADRPMHLLLRTPSWAGSREVERRINYRFQTTDPFKNPAAASQDEGYIHVYVPKTFHGDWEHFMGVATHLFMNPDGDFNALKARQLADEARKPDAPLMDISYCWEAIGPAAIPYITPLLTSDQQDIQFAAARAAAFMGDHFGETTLVKIAQTPKHPFQVNAVQTLGALPGSARVNLSLARLLDSGESLVRIEAYKSLINRDTDEAQPIFSRVIHPRGNNEGGFVLDLIESKGPPLIYCSRMGQPRVAVFGHKLAMRTPATFSAFDAHLTIATLPDRPHTLNIFYREEGRRNPVQALSNPDVGEIIARLGGATDDGLHFNYGDVVAILQGLVAREQLSAAFVLQQAPGIEREIQESPSLPDQGRPQANATSGQSPQIGASLPELPLPVVAKPGEKPKDDATNGSGRPQ